MVLSEESNQKLSCSPALHRRAVQLDTQHRHRHPGAAEMQVIGLHGISFHGGASLRLCGRIASRGAHQRSAPIGIQRPLRSLTTRDGLKV